MDAADFAQDLIDTDEETRLIPDAGRYRDRIWEPTRICDGVQLWASRPRVEISQSKISADAVAYDQEKRNRGLA